MSVEPPKIDKRTYDEIVAQTEALAGQMTCVVQPTIAALLGRILAQDVFDGEQWIEADGELITEELAQRISQIQGLTQIKVVGWQDARLVETPLDGINSNLRAMTGQVLMQDVIQLVSSRSPSELVGKTLAQDIQDRAVATRGTVIDQDLAERISQVPGLRRVKVILAPQGAEIDNALLARSTDLLPVTLRQNVAIQPDPGWALIRIFARMAALLSDRLNRVPDKNFLAFLDLIGTQIHPPQPARVPLTFSLVENSPVDAFVPARVQVAAPNAEDRDEVVFELENELVVTRSQLQAVFVCEQDRYQDCTAMAQGKTGAYPAFSATQPIPHSLYLGDERLTQPGEKSVEVTITWSKAVSSTDLPLTWAIWNSKANQWDSLVPQPTLTPSNRRSPAPPQATPTAADSDSSSGSQSPPTPSRDMWTLTMTLPALNLYPVNGQMGAWLRADFGATVTPQTAATLPPITAITLKVESDPPVSEPDTCLYNTVSLDISKPFFPFGEEPAFNDTFYLAHTAAFSQPDAIITLEISLGDRTVKASADLELIWEIWTSRRWQKLGRSTSKSNNSDNQPDFSDGSRAFTRGVNTTLTAKQTTNSNEVKGIITFHIPPEVVPITLSGEENYWIRIRINKGNYGEAAKWQPTTGSGTSTYELVEATFKPPMIETIALRYSLPPTSQTPQILTYNDFTYNDFTYTSPAAPFFPFTWNSDRRPALYLGFDQPFPNRSITFYLQVEPPIPGRLSEQTTRITYPTAQDGTEVRVRSVQGFQPGQTVRIAPGSDLQEDCEIQAIDAAQYKLILAAGLRYAHPQHTRVDRVLIPPRLVWEYAAGDATWKALGAIDETELLGQRGLVRFIGPLDMQPQSRFGHQIYWLRLRWESGEFLVQPRLRRILPNTTWAAQSITLTEEVLGSSTGIPDQRFFTSQRPVLVGQVLEVREELSPTEQETLLTRDPDRLKILRDEVGAVKEIWVRWQEVTDFYGSGLDDRHYVLDHLTGEVRFGDGQRGKVPPLGGQNLRLQRYQTGGGLQGNVPVGVITQLKTTIPYITAVVNLEAASGGGDQESLQQVQQRGPTQLRHRGRAVTAQDFEDLAFAASPEVARAKAISPAFSDQLDWLPTYLLPPNSADGMLELQLTWDSDNPDTLVASLYGPGQATPSQKQAVKNTKISFPLAANLTETPWRVTLSNPSSTDAIGGRGTLTYSSGTAIAAQAIKFSRLSSQPHSQVVDAGRVDLIIVPRSLRDQPTPGLGLLDRVEQYLRERCSPTLALYVTEPEWVEVTISATLVPLSLQEADTIRDRALRSLARFLHPLTGSTAGQGWAFGRLPQKSDVYALLESVTGVDYVKQLTIHPSTPPTTNSPNFLIYSGTHDLTLELL